MEDFYDLAVLNKVNKLGEMFVNVKDFGAKGDGITDDTIAIQNAINSLLAGGNVFFPTGSYLISSITISFDSINLIGVMSSNNGHGSFLIAKDTIEPLITINNPNRFLIGGLIRDLGILGSNFRNTFAGAKNKIAIKLIKVAEFNLENVFINGFLYGAIVSENWWDSTCVGVKVRCCGDGTNYAVYLNGTTDNTNAIHWLGCHLENNNGILKLSHLARHNQFVACKFEKGGLVTPTMPLIQIDVGVYENIFSDCQFATDYFDGFFINIDNELTIIKGCMFSTGDTNGAKWIKHTSNRLICTNNIFNQMYYGAYGIELGYACIFTNNVLYLKVTSNQARGIQCNGTDNLVTGNTIYTTASGTITSGAFFNSLSSRNIFKDNIFRGIAGKLYEGTSTSSVYGKYAEYFMDITNSGSFTIDLQQTFVSDNIKFNGSSAATLTNILNGYPGQRIAIYANTGDLLTIHHSSYIMLAEEKDYLLKNGDYIELVHNGSQWIEATRKSVTFLTSPNGTKYRITVDNSGVLSTSIY